MRVLVVSVPRTCSSVATTLIANAFNLTNLHEIYSIWNGLGDTTPYALKVFRNRHLNDPLPNLPDSLYSEDNYCGKLLSSVFLDRLDYRTFNWAVIDKIVFTVRADVVDQIASWLTLEALYADDPTRTPEARTAAHGAFTCQVNLARLPFIAQNFQVFNELYAYVNAAHPTRCVTISYEMFQAPDAAAQLSAATGWTIQKNHIDNLESLGLFSNQKNYSVDVTNYAELAAAARALNLTP